MENLIAGIILGVIAITCFVISALQFAEKGFLLNNAYIYASKRERETMDKKPHYRQSGMVFLFIGLIFGTLTVDMVRETAWLYWVNIALTLLAMVYAFLSSVKFQKKK